MKQRLITSALPYVNNIPHLGNLIQVLSADVFARFCRSRGYNTLYICGTDEYGTATETRALEEGKTPRELCDYYHAIHADIYSWFEIAFDYFGRTSAPQQTEITQGLFLDLDKNGFIKEQTIEQLFCPACGRFLADRYVRGVCPSCGSVNARGDQCEDCGKLLDPTELQEPRCSTCGGAPHLKSTKHLYIDLPAIQGRYAPWMEEASKKGRWSKNAVRMTLAWIRDGLHERAITRDLKWGIPVPKAGFEDKVFYVWFDAPIGYISITKALADKLSAEGRPSFDWQDWWLKGDGGDVELFQFIGKDNIPFHTVIFPSTLIGSGKNWTKLFHMSSTEYLNYESGKFSKSKGVGIFGTDAKESGIPADAWRFYIFYNRPEKADTQFLWKDFQERYNGELIGNLGNLVNRTLTFVARYYGGIIPALDPYDETAAALWQQVEALELRVTEMLEWAELKDALHAILQISDLANKAFQAGEPWKTRNTDPQKAGSLIANLCYVIKDLMILIHPYMPAYAQKVMSYFGKAVADPLTERDAPHGAMQNALCWKNLGEKSGLTNAEAGEIFFKQLDEKQIDSYRARYAGTQSERVAESASQKADTKAAAKKDEPKKADDPIAHFNAAIELKTAKIIKVEKHPEADKLYIETLDDGSGEERVILSGLVPYLLPEELLGKTIIVADNLKPRKMRGIESRGMLLAADYVDENGKECVEVLDCTWAPPGTPVVLEGAKDSNADKPAQIDADDFFAVDIVVKDKHVCIGGARLTAAGQPVTTAKTLNGSVH